MPDLDGTPISSQKWDATSLRETSEVRKSTITSIPSSERDQRIRVENYPYPGAPQLIYYENVQYIDLVGTLPATEVFTGITRDCLNFKLFTGSCIGTGTGTLFVECSHDGSPGTWSRDYEVFCDSNKFYPFVIEVVMRYVRISFYNGNINNMMRIITMLKRF